MPGRRDRLHGSAADLADELRVGEGQDAFARGAAVAEHAARSSYGKLLAFVAQRTRDLAEAEDALSEAFAQALHEWPRTGAPDKPEAWLLTVARRKATDAARKRQTARAGEARLILMSEELDVVNTPAEIPDERLGLMFACAHPAIDAGVRAPLMLQTILGFDAAAIAAAFLVSPAAMGQRLVRAKTKIKHAGVPFRTPAREDLAPRLEAVLDAIYAAYAEGWSDPQGADARLRNLAVEAIWLGRLIVDLMPDEPEALGLLALMLHTEARRGARRDADGFYVPLADQDVTRWDGDMIEEAEDLIRRATVMQRPGRYQLEAAVQSAHAVRRQDGVADWPAILALYDVLMNLTDSPVVAVNRAVALAQARGPVAGLFALDAVGDARLDDYQPYWAARADLLARAGDVQAAGAAYERAIALEQDQAARAFLEKRRAALGD